MKARAVTSVRIRSATAEDLDALTAMEAAFPPEDRFSRRTWARLLKGRTLALVAEIDGQIAGASVILLRSGIDIARLYSLSVATEARGKGLGGQLLAAGETAAHAQGARRMRLEVRERNRPARALYESAGYRVISLVESYYPDGETAVRMEKHLDPAAKGNS